MKEPKIKLFGRKILLPDKTDEQKQQGDDFEDKINGEIIETMPQDQDQDPSAPDESHDPNALLQPVPSIEENEPGDTTNTDQKPLKKPEKILPCPRCNSMDTKFCYYNNYKVNQPRHFCKSCQRYWTAGGTMRSVPVGAGRRRNKNLASNCSQLAISEALKAAQIDSQNGGTILSFGQESPRGENKSSCKMTMKSNQVGVQNLNGVPSHVPYFPWPFPWNSMIPVTTNFPQGNQIPFYPIPYWNYGLSLPYPDVNVNESGLGSGPNSPLGKHSRNGELLKSDNLEPKNSESSILVPKTLRIDDPEEAAKSSIWETLGIEYDSVTRKGLFTALQPKSDEKKMDSPLSMKANPAALSRSIRFKETS